MTVLGSPFLLLPFMINGRLLCRPQNSCPDTATLSWVGTLLVPHPHVSEVKVRESGWRGGIAHISDNSEACKRACNACTHTWELNCFLEQAQSPSDHSSQPHSLKLSKVLISYQGSLSLSLSLRVHLEMITSLACYHAWTCARCYPVWTSSTLSICLL